MKKVFALLLMLAMTMMCAGAMANVLPEGNGTVTKNGMAAKACTQDGGYHKHDDGSDYCLYSDGETTWLHVLASGLTISNFNGTGSGFAGIQIKGNDNSMTLTLDNVHVDVSGQDFVDYVLSCSFDIASLTLNLINTSLTGADEGVNFTSTSDNISLTVNGSGTITGKNDGIAIQSAEFWGPASISCTLSGNLTVSGDRYNAVSAGSGDTMELYFDGKSNAGVKVFVADNGPVESQYGPYYSLTEMYNTVREAKSIRTETENMGGAALDQTGDLPQTGADLPQTGDNSRLLVWVGMLALAGAGMIARRKREA